jgi:hypothetical protein
MTTSSEPQAPRKPSWRDPGDPPELGGAPAVDSITVEVELITSMLGGGVEPRKHDPHCWLRAASVKGQLRFWWRALYGHKFSTQKELWEAEGRIWGRAASFGENGKVLGGPGIVALCVRALPRLDGTTGPKTRPYPQEVGTASAYLLFPAQETEGDPPRVPPAPAADLVLPGERAELTLRFVLGTEDDRQQVRASLSAWLVLGGVGSRTRRGVGAVAARGEPPAELQIPSSRAKLVAYLREVCGGSAPGGGLSVFFLAGRTHQAWVGGPTPNAPAALDTLAGCWKRARSRRNLGKPPERPYLGLPLGPGPGGDGLPKRFASPVLFSVTRVGSQYMPVVIATLPTLRLPRGQQGGPPVATAGATAILNRVLREFNQAKFEKVFP